MPVDVLSDVLMIIKDIAKNSVLGDTQVRQMLLLIGICTLLHIFSNMLESYLDDKSDDAEDDEMLEQEKTWIFRRIPFGKNGYIYRYDDHFRLIQDDIYLTKEIYDIDDMYLNDDHHMVINHDGYCETVSSTTMSYITFNQIRNTLIDQCRHMNKV